MNGKLFPLLLSLWFANIGLAHAQNMDLEIAGLADKLSKTLVAKGAKNVAAIDFTDLQGQSTELGRFLSERLTIELVIAGGISMLDRANIKSILAEHKLTEEGLVNPANAKKLGEFAGVDSILIGNVTALDDGIELMVKTIETESAKIIAAGRIKFPKTKEIQQLLNRGISGNPATSTSAESAPVNGGGASYQEANAIATKDLGSLRVVLKSAIPRKQGSGGNERKSIVCSFDFVNLETQRPLVVALNATEARGLGRLGDMIRATLDDDAGQTWTPSTENTKGIGIVGAGHETASRKYPPTDIVTLMKQRDETGDDRSKTYGNHKFVLGSTTIIQPGQSSAVTLVFDQQKTRNSSTYELKQSSFFQMEIELVVGIVEGATNDYSLNSIRFDRISMPKF